MLSADIQQEGLLDKRAIRRVLIVDGHRFAVLLRLNGNAHLVIDKLRLDIVLESDLQAADSFCLAVFFVDAVCEERELVKVIEHFDCRTDADALPCFQVA